MSHDTIAIAPSILACDFSQLARAGARMLVAGSSVFKHEDRSRAIATIRAAAQDGVARA